MAIPIGGGGKRKRHAMPPTRKTTLTEMAKEYLKLGMAKRGKLTGKANAITRGQGKKVGLHKTAATQLAKRGTVPVKPVAKKPATSGSAAKLQKLRSMK